MKVAIAKLAAVVLLLGGLTFGQVPSARVRVYRANPNAPVGQRIFQEFVDGTQTKVAEVNASLAGGASFTVAAAGFARTKTPGLRHLLLQDILPQHMASGYIRVFRAPAVDAYVGAPDHGPRTRTAALTNALSASTPDIWPSRPIPG